MKTPFSYFEPLAVSGLLLFVSVCSSLDRSSALLASRPDGYYEEPHRPQFHFTPETNWMNDPNGMVYYDGDYHLFYQYNPFGDKWGHMSWGHAVSPDMVHWEHLPVALYEENGVMIFSGSAVVDWHNTSGFGIDGRPPLVAVYTGHYTEQPLQNQHIAYSNDRGRTWTKHEGNPVLDIGLKDFRDPKVMWHEESAKWVMTVSMPTDRKVRFYGSPNLKDWSLLGEFGPAGAVKGIWECPDLFPLEVEGTSETKWVLVVNIGGDAIAGGSGCQYFVGDFDGETFVEDRSSRSPAPAPKEPVPMRVITDFEGEDYGDWTATGEAFGSAPASGALPGQQGVTGFRGTGLVNSFRNGDAATGTLTSPEFTIDADHLNFLMGGGNHPNETGMVLLIDGEAVRAATGNNEERLDWQSWDVRELRGKSARLQIFDRHTGGWGHVNIDQIVLANEPGRPAAESANWVDYGKDFYAAVSWSDVPENDGRRLWLGWMSNWQYANDVPTSPWRSAMSIPRSLSLRKVDDRWLLVQTPVGELEVLRGTMSELKLRQFSGSKTFEDFEPDDGVFEARAGLLPSPDAVIEFELRTGADESTTVTIDVPNRILTLDRTRSGLVDFSDQFPAAFEAPIRLIDGELDLRVFVDTSSVEVFVNNGETVTTSLILPTGSDRTLSLSVPTGTLDAVVKAWPLISTWRR